MKFPEHVALSYLVAQLGAQQEYGLPGTLLVLIAGNLPDVDTLTLLGGWRFYRTYHRIVGHGLPVTLLGPALLAAGASVLGLGAFWPLWAWLQLALLVHLATDVCFYRWPVQLLWPVSRKGFGLGLVRWNDLVPTLVLYIFSVAALLWPGHGFAIGLAGLACFVAYLFWRAWQPPAQEGWRGWLTGLWAPHAAPFWRWLTGDFVT
ncbi:MAG: metal-dependent hydrolase [Planctomycetota bacterium]|nr:MAG: metal-dependent hydrolase [Planctomycetota bacterium]